MRQLIEITYSANSSFGGYMAGSKRFIDADELAQWIEEKTANGYPVLITSIRIA